MHYNHIEKKETLFFYKEYFILMALGKPSIFSLTSLQIKFDNETRIF